jgi:hypothetical protein
MNLEVIKLLQTYPICLPVDLFILPANNSI